MIVNMTMWERGPEITITIRKMRDDETRGYGPSYANDPKGAWWLAWVEDCFDPPIYAFREDSWENAYDLAAGALCPEYEPKPDESPEDSRSWLIEGAACPHGVDTETLHLIRWRG